MYLFLLKKALPFTLTFIFGAALSALVGLFGSSEKKSEWVLGTRTYEFGRSCRMSSRRHRLVAESKPLTILYKPDARRPAELLGTDKENIDSFWVSVTFGADGKVYEVKPTVEWVKAHSPGLAGHIQNSEFQALMHAVESAAKGIRFEPEKVDGRPVTVTNDVEIRFFN